MKSLFFLGVTLVASTSAFAQKQEDLSPYNKEKLDSMFRSYPRKNQPFVMPAPKDYSFPENTLTGAPSSDFEKLNPGATIINTTPRGTIYNMPQDNMAVLVPDMNAVERMPGGNKMYRVAPPGNMPNPLYPNITPKRKKTQR
ncbi:MAG: hypothetical protein QM726_21970 [Chitinophagaceae bacterium]